MLKFFNNVSLSDTKNNASWEYNKVPTLDKMSYRNKNIYPPLFSKTGVIF